jgi:hypothetical protein
VGLNIEKTSIDDPLVNTHFILGIIYFNMRDFHGKSQTQNKEYKYYQIMYYLFLYASFGISEKEKKRFCGQLIFYAYSDFDELL